MCTWSNIEYFLKIAETILGDLSACHEPVDSITFFLKSFEKKPIHKAAYEGNIEAVNSLISSGYVIEIEDDFGYTPLDYAMGNCHWEIAKLLLGDRYNDRSYMQLATYDQACTLLHQKDRIYNKPILKRRALNAPYIKYTPAEIIELLAQECCQFILRNHINSIFYEQKNPYQEINKIMRKLKLSVPDISIDEHNS